MTLSPILTSFDELVLEHLPLARHHALQYRGRGVELEELVQVANLALVKAAHGFDADRGAFAPYAAATIRGDIKKYFRDHAWSVRPPRRVQELQAAITAATDVDAGHHDIDELASDLDVDPEDVVEALSARGCFRSESTDREVGTSGLTIGETLACTDADLELVEEWVTFCRLSRRAHQGRARAAANALRRRPHSAGDRGPARRQPDAGVPQAAQGAGRHAPSGEHPRP